MVMGEITLETEVLVIGGGPGGYAAAFRAADLGKDVTLVDQADRPGGVCLFRGCIPSKTYLHLSELIHDADHADSMGLHFEPPSIDLPAIRRYKSQVIDKMADGLVSLSNKRGVQRVKGRAVFENSQRVSVFESEVSHINFQHAILATGSHPIGFPGVPFKSDGRIMNSAAALELKDVPESLLVIGGGYVGLELGSVYAALGSRITVVELGDRLLPGVDADLVKPLQRRLESTFEHIHLNTKVTSLLESEVSVEVTIRQDSDESRMQFDKVLVAIGRQPNSNAIDLKNTGVQTDDRGFIRVNEQQMTSDER